MRTHVGRVIRDLERKCSEPDETLKEELRIAKRIYDQHRHQSDKMYSVHEPEAARMAKRKLHKRYSGRTRMAT